MSSSRPPRVTRCSRTSGGADTRQRLPDQANSSGSSQGSFWDNNILNSAYGLNARSILLECIVPGADTTCTYGISATNVQLDSLEDTSSTAVLSDAGKFAQGVKIEYLIVYP